ncbi:MAG: peptide chain release factor N(5)-glutamine methyltransferase [Deltaproteobacteria bacterium]|nr:peptide chain release factor N(5)-glutamine methyltransferase [Deltaproteobacteria bacterium]
MSSTQATWTILSVLDWTRGFFGKKGLSNPRLDAEVLVAHALEMERVMLYARFDQPLLPEELATIRALVQRRGRGEPIAYIVRSREFYSLELEVGPDVLIPRPDTEVLVEVALDLVRPIESPIVVDVGTGSGNVAIAIAKERPTSRVVALDVSKRALDVARRNAMRHGLDARVSFFESDLLRALPSDVVPDLLVANLPYIPKAQISALMTDVREFEPRVALDGGDDGLDLIRALIDQAPRRAAIALEAGDEQVDSLRDELTRAGFSNAAVRRDYGGLRRVAYAKGEAKP